MKELLDAFEKGLLVGGEIETHQDGIVRRGPITEAEIKGDKVCITTPWAVVKTTSGLGEKESGITHRIGPENESEESHVSRGVIYFKNPCYGIGYIFPVGTKMELGSLQTKN
jgi:hypothetical protein